MSNMTVWARPSWTTDRWAREFFGPAAASDWLKPLPAGFHPAAEVISDGDDAVIRVELPGVDVEKDVKVDVEDGRLVIHGERRDEYATEGATAEGRILREVRYGSFRRSFTLPEHSTGDDVTASYTSGVLTVRVSGANRKPEAPGAKRIAIDAA